MVDTGINIAEFGGNGGSTPTPSDISIESSDNSISVEETGGGYDIKLSENLQEKIWEEDNIVSDDESLSIEETQNGYNIQLEDSLHDKILATEIREDSSDADLNIADEEGNVIMQLKGGHVRTKKFDSSITPISFNLDQTIFSVNPKYSGHYLNKIAFAGDSLIANAIGGEIPTNYYEGSESTLPMRLRTNNIPRRFYDKLSWNKPEWRRLDNSEWTKSGFSTFTENDLFAGTQEVYHTAHQSGSYARITVPDGYEHFALIVRTKSGNGSFGVQINGVNPSSLTYENPILTYNTERTSAQLINMLENNSYVNTDVVPINLPVGANVIDTNIGTTPTGNPYAIYQWNNLPAGDNEIQITAISGRIDIWGCFWWSGNTMVVINCAHGGHTNEDLDHHYPDELYGIDYDLVFYEVPEMNNLRLSLERIETAIKKVYTNLDKQDVVYTSCQALGLSIVHNTNFYASYTNPTQRQINDLVREIMFHNQKPFIDLFTYYEILTKQRGGTVEHGDVGLYFTWDGQHGNEIGVEIWSDILISLAKTKPIYLE